MLKFPKQNQLLMGNIHANITVFRNILLFSFSNTDYSVRYIITCTNDLVLSARSLIFHDVIEENLEIILALPTPRLERKVFLKRLFME